MTTQSTQPTIGTNAESAQDEPRTAFQTQFVETLIESVRREVTRNILQGRIPADWDGIELRKYIADKFNDCVCNDLIKGKRLREYRNIIAISNL